MRSPPKERVERLLHRLFEALAPQLIQLGITPARVSELQKIAFAKAGASIARKKHSERLHIARLAAITGLTRTEVTRIVATNFAFRPATIETAPRTLRVLQGWKTAKGYSKRGLPLPLKLQGAIPSFESLCRKYSGDIPHTTILTEFQSIGLAQLTVVQGKPIVIATRSRRAAGIGHVDESTFAAHAAKAISDENKRLSKLRTSAAATSVRASVRKKTKKR